MNNPLGAQKKKIPSLFGKLKEDLPEYNLGTYVKESNEFSRVERNVVENQ